MVEAINIEIKDNPYNLNEVTDFQKQTFARWNVRENITKAVNSKIMRGIGSDKEQESVIQDGTTRRFFFYKKGTEAVSASI